MLNRKVLILMPLLAWALFGPSEIVAQADLNIQLTQYLTQHYKKKDMLLRHFYSAAQLKYDASGDLIGRTDPGFWTVYGIVRIEKIEVSNQRIEIQAKRMFMAADTGKKLDYVPENNAVFIVIEFDPRNFTAESADNIFSKIFLNQQDHFEELVPGYWKKCIEAASAGREGYYQFSKKFLSLPGVHFTQTAAVPSPPIKHGRSVSPPKPINTPDLSYSLEAGQIKIEGSITLGVGITTAGQTTNIWIRRPLGYGLDERAIATMKTWKFLPALEDGKPVEVNIEVEMGYQKIGLFNRASSLNVIHGM